MSAEQFVCLNCLNVGELNQHGRCSSCDSDSVLSRELVVKSAAGADSRQYRVKDTTIYGYLVSHPSGFETFVSTPNQAIAYSECTDPLTKWYVGADSRIDPDDVCMKAMTRDEYIEWVKRERS